MTEQVEKQSRNAAPIIVVLQITDAEGNVIKGLQPSNIKVVEKTRKFDINVYNKATSTEGAVLITL